MIFRCIPFTYLTSYLNDNFSEKWTILTHLPVHVNLVGLFNLWKRMASQRSPSSRPARELIPRQLITILHEWNSPPIFTGQLWHCFCSWIGLFMQTLRHTRAFPHVFYHSLPLFPLSISFKIPSGYIIVWKQPKKDLLPALMMKSPCLIWLILSTASG